MGLCISKHLSCAGGEVICEGVHSYVEEQGKGGRLDPN